MIHHASKCFRDPPPFLVPGLIRYNSIHVINADPFTGKSALATGIAVSVALGKPLFKNGLPSCQGRVLFFAIDAPDWDYGTLLRKVCSSHGLSSRDLADNDVPLYYVFREAEPNIEARTQMEKYIYHAAHIDEEGLEPPDLVIVDTLLNMHSREENDTVAMKQVMKAFAHWHGTSWLILHHNSKSPLLTGGAKARGSGVISGSADMHLMLKRGRKKAGDKGITIVGEWAKGRGGDLPEKMSYTMSWDDFQIDFNLPSPAVGPRAAFLEKLSPNKTYSWNELQKLAGVSAKELKDWLEGTEWNVRK